MHLPTTAWRAQLLSEAVRLEGERVRAAAWLDELHGVPADAEDERAAKWPPHALVDHRLAGESIEMVRRLTAQPGTLEMARRWGSGSDVEMAWRSLHAADAALLMIEDDAVVLARLPEIKASIEANLPPDDGRVDEYGKFLDGCGTDDLAASRSKIRTIKTAADSAQDAALGNLRTYRNWLWVVGTVLSAALVLVAWLHLLDNSFFKLCASATGANGACTSSVNLAEIEVAGALGGLVGAVFALNRLKAYGGPYSLPLWQALLRIPSGAAGALVGIFIMQSGVISNLAPQPANTLVTYALVFGYAPDLLLRLLDQKVNSVSESARTKNDPLRSRKARA